MAIPDLLNSKFNFYEPGGESAAPDETLEEGNPPGVNLAHALEIIGFDTGACGELSNMAWADVNYNSKKTVSVDLDQGLNKLGFTYCSSEVQQGDEKKVRIFAKQIPKLKIVSDQEIQFGSGGAAPDVCEVCGGPAAGHEHPGGIAQGPKLFPLDPKRLKPDYKCDACEGSGGSGLAGSDGKESACFKCSGYPTAEDLDKHFTSKQLASMIEMWHTNKSVKENLKSALDKMSITKLFEDELLGSMKVPPEFIGIKKEDIKFGPGDKYKGMPVEEIKHFKTVIVSDYLDGKHGNQEPFTGAFKSMDKIESLEFLKLVKDQVCKNIPAYLASGLKITEIAPHTTGGRHLVRFSYGNAADNNKVTVFTQSQLLKCCFEACGQGKVNVTSKNEYLGESSKKFAQEYMGKFAEHQHVWDDAPDGTLHCSVCGKPKVGPVFALTKDPAIEMFKEIMDKKLAKAMAKESDAAMATAAEQFEKMMGKHVGIDLGAGEDMTGITISTDDGQNYTLNVNSLKGKNVKLDSVTKKVLLGTINVGSLKPGDAEQIDCGNGYKLYAARQPASGELSVVLAWNGEQLVFVVVAAVAMDLDKITQVMAERVINNDGSMTYIVYRVSNGVPTVLATAQRSSDYAPAIMDEPGLGELKIKNSTIKSEFLIQLTNGESGKPLMSITKDGKIIVDTDFELFFHEEGVQEEFAAKFWEALDQCNPLRTKVNAQSAIINSLVGMLKQVKVDAALEKEERDRVKVETRQQTRMRRILGDGF